MSYCNSNNAYIEIIHLRHIMSNKDHESLLAGIFCHIILNYNLSQMRKGGKKRSEEGRVEEGVVNSLIGQFELGMFQHNH